MIMITGATGKVGTELTAQLQAQQIPFRALAHTGASFDRLQQQHIETFLVGDPYSAELAAAFEGIDSLFLLLPTSPDQAAIERRFTELARHASVRHIVKLSVLGADDPEVALFRPHRESERFIERSGVAFTFLRPNAFMQNIGTADLPTITQRSFFANSAGDGAVSLIDTRDIAAVALAALSDTRHHGQTYELTGPQSLSYTQAAEKLTNLLNRPIHYVALSDAAYCDALVAAGLPDWYADGLAAIYRFYRSGRGSAVTDLVEQITGRPARTLDAYLADHRALFEPV